MKGSGAEMVRLQRVTREYGEVVAVRDVDLAVRQGEFLTLLGPSGCGKTTTLRMIAGFERPTRGRVFIDGQPVEDLPPFQRAVNTVFQHYALFPHMTVWDNIAFGLRMKSLPRPEVDARVEEMLRLIQLPQAGRRRPRLLSGGQQQRVALARALINQPKVLLLDEPLGALDLKLRKQMQVELKHLQQQLGTTFIYVTHDQEEALTMSDRVAVMNEGRVEHLGTPEEVYERPATGFVAGFIGEANLLPGELVQVGGGRAVVAVGPHRMLAGGGGAATAQAGARVDLCVRPERVRLGEAAPENQFPARVTERIYVGSWARLHLELEGGIALAAMHPTGAGPAPAVGEQTTVSWEVDSAVILLSQQAART